MKSPLLAGLLVSTLILHAQKTPEPAPVKPTPPPLTSRVYAWEDLPVATTPNGERRDVFDGPTATLDQAHCHITTLRPGAQSGEPRRHLQEEVIVIKSGEVELSVDGRLINATAGSVVFLASNAVTRLRNARDIPATYYVIYYRTPLTPKG